jgi:glucose-1-phosphate adenylyltransferase
LGVGNHSVIEGAIIDKNARIGKNVKVTNERATKDSEEHPTHVIRDGIVVIPKSAVLRDGTVI